MSREIKFRAWDKWKKSIIQPNGGDFIGWHSMSNWKDCLEVMQYTGMKDSNGVEIYEGDIVSFTYWWFDGNIAESTLTGAIVYSAHSMSFQLKGVKNKEWERHTGYENDSDYLTPFSELNFEEADFLVIGNIHQNPELITTDAQA